MQLEDLLARAAIVDVLNRYAQAIDRRDWIAARAAFHEDAMVDYGAYTGDLDGLFDYISTRHTAIEQSMHFMGQTVVDLHGQSAFAITPNIVIQRRGLDEGGHVAMFGDAAPQGHDRPVIEIGSRYLDRMDNRGDGWKMASRTVVYEWMRPTVEDVRSNLQATWKLASRGPDDPVHGFGPGKAGIPA